MEPWDKPIDGFLLSNPDYDEMTVGIDIYGTPVAIISRDGEECMIEFYKHDASKTKPVPLALLIAELVKAQSELAKGDDL